MPLTVATLALAISAALSTGAPSAAANTIATSTPPQTVSGYVAQYFANEPIMISIAACESHDRQFDTNGNVYRGEVNHQDVGVMQINEHYHLTESQSLGYDIYTIQGNTAFAQYLYEKEGTAPWDSSSGCWDPSKSKPSSNTALATIAK
jgi:hypothetical protein